ncbi:hypothetical protein K5K93_19740 [Stenotrophomonas sp. DR822]|uniref:hypothetical protein n=1 Tax=Stenotrophomonas sp. DR822 TaxID=2871174 RepID=UPI001C954A92|nr:hypothetical protein [Stenotrophomonas sp. DR822]QZN80792.1 hypothetical protein K5K93_19740 [Stenotrophomonas sp. DR822]
MRPPVIVMVALLVAAPAFGKEPQSVYLERGHDPALAATAVTAEDAPKQSCRVVKEWKAGETVVQHRICDDPPKRAAAKPAPRPMQR